MIKFNNEKYDTIEKFNGIVIKLGYSTGNDGFMTCLPISDSTYRIDSPTHARAVYTIGRKYTKFTIYDDWGDSHVLEIENIHKDYIKNAIDSLNELELLNNKSV